MRPDKGGIMADTARAELSQEELDQRVAVLRRFRTLLAEQRDRFRTYLAELDKQKDLIESGSAEELIAHVELEEKIVADIFAIQKVIDPLDEMYHAISPAALSRGAGSEVQGLKSALEGLKKEAVVRSSRNKDLLSHRMAEIREEMKALRANPYLSGGYGKRSAFAPAPALVDITG
jgi:hypothetical protein